MAWPVDNERRQAVKPCATRCCSSAGMPCSIFSLRINPPRNSAAICGVTHQACPMRRPLVAVHRVFRGDIDIIKKAMRVFELFHGLKRPIFIE